MYYPINGLLYIYIYITQVYIYTYKRIIFGVYIVKGCIRGFAPLIYQVLPSRG